MTALLIGAYGTDMDGSATGIAYARSTPLGLSIAGAGPECPSPSWLERRGDRLVATLEGTGELAWFARGAGGWRADGVTELAGKWPCHAAFLDDDTVAVACYGDGAVVVARHGARTPLQRLDGRGSGPLPAQDGPHAHRIHVLPDGRVLSLDLGADRVHIHERTTDGGLRRTGELVLPEGAAPRDLLSLPTGRLVLLGEWSAQLFVLQSSGDGFEIVQSLVLPGATPGADQAAALGLSDDGRFLYAGIRGADRIAVLACASDRLAPVGWVPSGGCWPRHLFVDGGLLHIAHQNSDGIASFRLASDGMPELLGVTATPSPSCIIAE